MTAFGEWQEPVKVTGVKTTEFAQPAADPSGPASHCLVELRTDDDLAGTAVGPRGIGPVTARLVGDLLAGEDPRAVVALWQKMADTVSGQDNDETLRFAIAALDFALWDLKARANHEPLWRTLGGMRPRANAHLSDSASLPAAPEAAGRFGDRVSEYGFREGKLGLGNDMPSDRQRLAMMREALSRNAREPVLMIDARGRWATAEAIKHIARLEADFDLTCVEAPVDASDIQGLKRVSDGVYAAVCAGRNLYGVADYLPYFQQHAIDIVQIDIRRTGVTAAQQIADTAYGLELPVTLCASPGNLAVHLAAAMPNFMSLEVTDPESSNGLLASDIRIDNGRAIAGDSPGCGLAVDRAALAAAPHDRERR